MSRIIVKNLPPKATEEAIRKHFDSKGRITDVKIMRKRDGSSRRFAFVGFKSDSEAHDAAQFFNLSFMNSSRLQVDLARALGDETLERRKESLKRKRLAQREEESKPQRAKQPAGAGAADAADAKLNEFLKVMQPQKATALWQNDNTEGTVHAPEDKDDDDVVDMRSLRAPNGLESGEGGVGREAEPNEFVDREEGLEEDLEEDLKEDPEEEEWNPQLAAEEGEEGAQDGAQDAVSDMDWLRQRQTRIKENGEIPVRAPAEAEAELEQEQEQEEAGAGAAEDTRPRESNRLFVRNLAFSVERADLEELFRPFGAVKEVHLPIDPKSDKPKGLAFVEFDDVAEAVRAHAELDGRGFQGRLLHILFAEPQRSYKLDEFDIKNMPLKKQQALKRRMQAAKQQFSWNSLYMNPDTVLEAAAKKLNMTKAQFMDPLSSNMAVKQALAESSVLESVQTYFKSRGVDLNKFAGSKELSDSVILAKNLPSNTSAPELQDTFAQFGEVARTLMPPDGGIAIVQFKLASAGRAAFKGLAFRRVGDSIMYLQKAPKGILDDAAAQAGAEPGATGAADATPAPKQATSAREMLLPDSQADASREAGAAPAEVRTSVFIKNLSFATPLESLAKLLKPLQGFVTAQIKTKPDPQSPGKVQSMGFGFAEFRTLRDAEVAIDALQGHVLDGHSLQLKVSTRGADSSSAPKPKHATTAKIIIKNIPFETAKKDIVDLFGTFGQLRSVRVPKKFNKQTRGFAFAEFATPKEAEHAMSALQGTHLLGRRLVMDYAEADAEDAETEIARMEAKVAKQVAAVDAQGRRIGGQLKSFDMEEEEDF